MTRRLALIVGGLILMGLVGTGIYTSVKWAYGGYGDYYYVTADLDRTGQQLKIGGDVRIRGVVVGKISGIELVDRRARVTLELEKDQRIPSATEGVVSLKTPLGAKFIDLQFDPRDSGPYLQDGDALASARVGPELEDVLADGTRVLEAINPDVAANLITNLADASEGHGDDVSRGLVANSRLSNLFASTLDPQLEALDDFITIFGELERVGGDLNDLADAINEGVPVYASADAQQNFRDALEAVVPFSENLADLLILNRSDWDRLFRSQDIVFQTIADRPEGLRNLVQGLATYVMKLGMDIDPFFRLEDGSAGAGFVAISGGNDEEEETNQICDAFPPPIRDQIPACKARMR
jgi:phospholipid/cholesterol/gamma-HCH transport system substrate-binding protein